MAWEGLGGRGGGSQPERPGGKAEGAGRNRKGREERPRGRIFFMSYTLDFPCPSFGLALNASFLLGSVYVPDSSLPIFPSLYFPGLVSGSPSGSSV